MIQAWFQGGPSTNDEPASLLDGWKAYEANSHGKSFPTAPDVESGDVGSGDPFAPFLKGASSTVAGAWTRLEILSELILVGIEGIPGLRGFQGRQLILRHAL